MLLTPEKVQAPEHMVDDHEDRSCAQLAKQAASSLYCVIHKFDDAIHTYTIDDSQSVLPEPVSALITT